MNNTIKASILTIAGLLTSGAAFAAPITLLSHSSEWNYNVTSSNISHNSFGSYDFSTFESNYTGSLTGTAGFSNSAAPSGLSSTTYWSANTDLALQTQIDLTGSVIGDVTLSLAVDNGAIVFVNGTKVFSQVAEGYTSMWEYNQTIDGDLFNIGLNTISVLAEDHGGGTYFDMQLVANDGLDYNTSKQGSAVPEPSILALLGLGLAGLGFSQRRRRSAV